MFIDKIEIAIKAGKGGNGVNSFYRDRFMRPGRRGKGRPDGGDGGKGGDIIIKVDRHIHTLLDLYYRKNFSAQPGLNGEGNCRKGRGGSDCIIKVPPGTVVKDKSSGCLLRDLKAIDDTLIAAKGGEYGKGNIHAEAATQGQEGEYRDIILELKLIADVGLIGFPNAGKSTLLSSISHARPKIAPYPFTTKSPVLGIARCGDFSFVVADIPGLISDAHKGKGLGFEFLRHIERTKILVHIIDMASVDGRNPTLDYHAINQELRLYSEKLAAKPQIVAANKMDLPQAEGNLKKFRKEISVEIIPISAQNKENLEELLNAAQRKLQESCS
ncbi:MAG: GTPase ObgE [Candidatus Omnitrophota bacterium]|nr:GTPase ObgE [Candidatus Omnitrophota bacterium]